MRTVAVASTSPASSLSSPARLSTTVVGGAVGADPSQTSRVLLPTVCGPFRTTTGPAARRARRTDQDGMRGAHPWAFC